MATDDQYYPGASEDEGFDELARLNALHDDLVDAVQSAINPTVRADLAAELRSVRERIAELSQGEGGESRRAPDPGQTQFSYEVPPAPADPAGNGAAFDHGYDQSDYGQAGGGVDQGPYPTNPGYDPAYGYQQSPHDTGRHQAFPPSGPAPFAQEGSPFGNQGGWEGQRPAAGDPQARVPLAVESSKGSFWSGKPWLPLALAIVGGLALAAYLGFGGLGGDDDAETAADSADGETDPAGAEAADGVVSNIRAVLDGMGLSSVQVANQEGTIVLTGTTNDTTDREAAIGAATALTGGLPFDSSGLTVAAGDAAAASPDTGGSTSEAAGMQREISRLLAATPIIFDSGQTAVTERHQRILNNIVSTMSAYPGIQVTVVGYTDDQGTPEANEALSAARAQNVKDYLVSQGVPSDSLAIRGAGEQDATGAATLANLERRVEFEVSGAAVPSGGEGLRVAVVAPSARNDLAFTQSMVDAIDVIAQERSVEVAITDNTFVPDEAAEAIRTYAEQGYDLIIAHGSQFGGSVAEIAPQYPEVAFAWGTAADTFDLPNVYAYDAKSQEGGYVLGALAASLSGAGTVGVVGPIEVGDAALYVNGFQAGAEAERPGTNVLVTYTGSFSEIGLASETAQEHIAAGADVMTGSAQMVVGAVDVAAAQGVLWFGTQANQSSLAPELVVASQVYHWEIVLRPILADLDQGNLAGTSYSLDLANGGLVIEYNDGYALSAEARQRADQLVGEISAGTIVPPAG